MKIQGTATLGVAQGLALAAALGSATVYATWLDAAQLATWALALGAGRAAQLLVDGGFKAALVRHPQGLQVDAEARLTRRVLAVAAGLSSITVFAAASILSRSLAASASTLLVAGAVVAYLVSHAASMAALARLERGGRFDRIGRVEGGATMLEFALPGLLLAAGLEWVAALLAGLLLGRTVRALGIALAARGVGALRGPGLDAAPWRDSLAMQSIAALGMLRDQVHLWLVGPLFGAAWAGAYAFGLMACALASQVAVATVSRVAVPALRPLSPRRRAMRAARSLRRLALWTVPPLLLTWPLLQWADGVWWDGRWQLAMALLPGLVVRMAAGLPLAVLGPWLTVTLPTWAAARVHARWTAAELVLAGAALAWLGPSGLALSWALGGALGTLMFMNAMRPHGLGWFLGALVRQPAMGRRRWSMLTCS
jgi:hypothetical protein